MKTITEEVVKDMAAKLKEYVLDAKLNGIAVNISGGKDSTIVAGLAKMTGLPVIGIMLPNGVQPDITDSYRVVRVLDIPYKVININGMKKALLDETVRGEGEAFEPSVQATTNMPPRLRMTAGRFVAQCYGYLFMNTCNRSETMVGYETIDGDAAGDYAPLAEFTVREVLQIGDILTKLLNLPADLIHKTPSDGLCGKSDEDNLGVTYAEIDAYLLEYQLPKDHDRKERLVSLIKNSAFKRNPRPTYQWLKRG